MTDRLRLESGRTLVIGEVAQGHDGSLGMAHAYLDAIADAGADAVKFQTHIAAAESTPAEPWRVPFSKQDATRYDYWRRMEFTEEQWVGLRRHADERGLHFLSSPFSLEAVALLERVGMPAWKVASGEVGNLPLLQRMVATGIPMLLSSGMSDLAELDRAMQLIQESATPVAVMQCTSSYPTGPEAVGLNLLEDLRVRYGTPVGLSDHSGTIFPALAAATWGVEVVEVHVTFSREMFGPDVVASVTTAEFRELVRGVRFIEAMRSNPVDKDAVAEAMEPLRQVLTKSVVAVRRLEAGAQLKREDLALKKPGSGIPARNLETIIGRRLRHDVEPNEPLREDDLE